MGEGEPPPSSCSHAASGRRYAASGRRRASRRGRWRGTFNGGRCYASGEHWRVTFIADRRPGTPLTGQWLARRSSRRGGTGRRYRQGSVEHRLRQRRKCSVWRGHASARGHAERTAHCGRREWRTGEGRWRGTSIARAFAQAMADMEGGCCGLLGLPRLLRAARHQGAALRVGARQYVY